jgi:hypothetical protein
MEPLLEITDGPIADGAMARERQKGGKDSRFLGLSNIREEPELF